MKQFDATRALSVYLRANAPNKACSMYCMYCMYCAYCVYCVCCVNCAFYMYCRAYDKILRWPDNMSGHYIFSMDILKNTRTIIIIVISIIIIILSLICRYTHTVYILYINIICVPTLNRNNEFIL